MINAYNTSEARRILLSGPLRQEVRLVRCTCVACVGEQKQGCRKAPPVRSRQDGRQLRPAWGDGAGEQERATAVAVVAAVVAAVAVAVAAAAASAAATVTGMTFSPQGWTSLSPQTS